MSLDEQDEQSVDYFRHRAKVLHREADRLNRLADEIEARTEKCSICGDEVMKGWRCPRCSGP